MKQNFRNIFLRITDNKILIFLFFLLIVFASYNKLFNSYFEADEWLAFAHFLPLTHKDFGFLDAIVKAFADIDSLSGSEHVVPLSYEIFFLSVRSFGMNFVPYAFLSLLLHSINSFLVFLFTKELFNSNIKKQDLKVIIFALLSGIFFALSPLGMHAVTWAAGFGQNVLPVTFFLLSIISFKMAFNTNRRKLLYFSFLFLLLGLLTKETAVSLFLLLPLMAIIEKRVFPTKFLGKLFILSLIIFLSFRFLIPNVYQGIGPLIDKLIGNYVSSSIPDWQKSFRETKVEDTGTIVSRDISIHKNLPSEILFRTVTFPIKMAGTLFLPRQTVFSIVNFITPIIQPVPPGGDSAEESQVRLGFLYGVGNAFIIYLASIVILIFCASQIFRFVRRRQIQEAQTLTIGLAIIVLGALPLVAIIFSFPRWGYDFYFDSRHNYNPNVGAAIVFPFLLFGLAGFISKPFRKKRIFPLVVSILFVAWFINNMIVLNGGIKQFTQNFQPDRRRVVEQLKKHLPVLPKNVVFYFETDGLSAFGPILPFYTNIPQAISVIYYDKSPLPDSFFNKPLFGGQGEGYQYLDGQGFGYYTSKKNLSEALLSGKFETSDIHAFYYKSLKGELSDKTLQVRKEMEDYLSKADILKWRMFKSDLAKIRFLYPTSTSIDEIKSVDSGVSNSLILKDPQFNAEMFFIPVSSSFNINDIIQFLNRKDGTLLDLQNITEKNVFFDKYHLNKTTTTDEDQPKYFMKFNNMLIYVKTENSSQEGLKLLERILGSFEIINEK